MRVIKLSLVKYMSKLWFMKIQYNISKTFQLLNNITLVTI